MMVVGKFSKTLCFRPSILARIVVRLENVDNELSANLAYDYVIGERWLYPGEVIRYTKGPILSRRVSEPTNKPFLFRCPFKKVVFPCIQFGRKLPAGIGE